jgi:hypothetical protein
MRAAAFVVLGFIAVVAAPLQSQAATAGATRIQAAPSSNIVEVDRRCGRGAHWVPGHRNRYGHWVRGHCSRNR